MEIEFDPNKDRINRQKHGVSLADAAQMDFGRALVIEDMRFDYGEPRFLAYAPIGPKLHVMYFTMRGSMLRVIGLRRANRRERQRYDRSF
ncbi:MAG: BrnT family toxin [Alphaproteobacteria bacterium]|nr:BrnT family toxin [Alphaproteobacteria bacterium]